jgi:hypothetical protein
MTSGLYESNKTKFLSHEKGRNVVRLPRKFLIIQKFCLEVKKDIDFVSIRECLV